VRRPRSLDTSASGPASTLDPARITNAYGID